MELGTMYVVLAYVGPICGIIGFIITPGLTHIRPWLIERFNKNEEDKTTKILSNNYNTMAPIDLMKEKIMLENNYKFDLRSKIRNRKKELNKLINKVDCINCDKKDKCGK